MYIYQLYSLLFGAKKPAPRSWKLLMKCATLCAEPVRKQIMDEIHLGQSGTEQGLLAEKKSHPGFSANPNQRGHSMGFHCNGYMDDIFHESMSTTTR